MYEQTNTMMETKTSFQIPQLLDGDNFTSEDLADDMEGLRLSFTRIKIPGGGHLQFEIPSGNPDVPDYAPYLEGVILYSHNSNAYWPEGSEYDDDQPPLCQSFDGKVGYGEPGGTCADCVLNQFGSDGNNKGKACKNMRMLYLLRSGEYMPIQIALPPTSLMPYTRFVNEAFLSRRRKVCTGVVRIGLKKAVSGSHEYCVATFTKIADFAGEDLAHIRAYRCGAVPFNFIQGTGGRKMYVLEFRTANRHHTWLRCAICETKAPLERVRRGQPNMTRWRILRLPGTVQAACAKWRSVPLMRYGQKSA